MKKVTKAFLKNYNKAALDLAAKELTDRGLERLPYMAVLNRLVIDEVTEEQFLAAVEDMENPYYETVS